MACITKNRSDDYIRIILEVAGDRIDVNLKRNSDGNTAIMLALDQGRSNVVTSLLDTRNVDLTISNDNGRTALMIATEKVSIVIVIIITNIIIIISNITMI